MMHMTFEGSGPRVVTVHGFTQTHRSWEPVVRTLPEIEFALVDLPGHGGSAEMRAGFEETVSMLAEMSDEKPAFYAGYSMGARLALAVAVDHPDAVRGLVLISPTAGIENPGARAARVSQDDALAGRVEEIGTKRFVDEWLARSIFENVPPTSKADRLTNSPEGLAHSLRHLGTGTMPSLWNRLAGVAAPTLLITGERDSKFNDLADRMAAELPSAEHTTVPGAGHAVHLEQPAHVARLLRDFVQHHS